MVYDHLSFCSSITLCYQAICYCERAPPLGEHLPPSTEPLICGRGLHQVLLRSKPLCRCWASPAPSDSDSNSVVKLTWAVCASAVSRPDSRSAPYAEQAENIPVTRMQHEYVPQRQQKEVQGKVSAPPELVLCLLQVPLQHAWHLADVSWRRTAVRTLSPLFSGCLPEGTC